MFEWSSRKIVAVLLLMSSHYFCIQRLALFIHCYLKTRRVYFSFLLFRLPVTWIWIFFSGFPDLHPKVRNQAIRDSVHILFNPQYPKCNALSATWRRFFGALILRRLVGFSTDRSDLLLFAGIFPVFAVVPVFDAALYINQIGVCRCLFDQCLCIRQVPLCFALLLSCFLFFFRRLVFNNRFYSNQVYRDFLYISTPKMGRSR